MRWFSLSMLFATLLSADCQYNLEASLALNDKCLSQLHHWSVTAKNSSFTSKEGVVAIVMRNQKLAHENRVLRAKVSNHEHLISDLKLSNQHLKNKLASLNTALLDKSGQSFRTVIRNNRVRFQNLSDTELIEKGYYRVPDYGLNIRKGPGKRFKRSGYAKKGDVLPFKQIHSIKRFSTTAMWAESEFGFFYLTHTYKQEIYSAFKQFSLKATPHITSLQGGVDKG